jgi:hypothetical protein
MAFPDDDDRNTILARRLSRFQEDMGEGSNPLDMLRMLKSPVPSLSRMYDLTKSVKPFMSDLLITGDRQQNDKLHGETAIKRNLPIFSTIYNVGQFSNEFLAGEDWFSDYTLTR